MTGQILLSRPVSAESDIPPCCSVPLRPGALNRLAAIPLVEISTLAIAAAQEHVSLYSW
ncbi:hypothetical protein KCP78_23465 [Salmonella enterica subsp. enterica]|nr:hypothetical protein KCP78_23465 [Salmonella enterica subsp. enterica]